jgi:SAM-dependent methyltransferase
MNPTHPTERFSSRVENYVQFRPSYPPALLADLESLDALTPSSVVVDVGAGTGLLTKLFLDHGNRVLGVEPNEPMRKAGQHFLKPYPLFTSINGTAEHTTLPSSSFDLVVAGQAFHWFDRDKARDEFRRILHLPAWVALIWNERDLAASPFQAGYEQLVQTYAHDYHEVDHRRINAAVIADFFGGSDRFHLFTHQNHQPLTPDQIRGRWLSSSYAPAPGHPRHEESLAALNTLITTHLRGPTLPFAYQTKMYVGTLD